MSDAQPTATIHPRLEEALQMPRIAIESTLPVLDEGRFAAKAVIGQPVVVTSKIFADGHDQLAAAVCWREKGETSWRRARLKLLGNDAWQGQFTPTQVAEHEFVIEAWWDVFESYRYELSKKHTAGVPVHLELEEGRLLLEKATARAQGENRAVLDDLMHRLGMAHSDDERVSLLLAPETAVAMAAADPREHCSRSRVYPLDVERTLAQFASWYELFPRSETDDPSRHGTFRDVHKRLPAIRDMGFDVLYFPPIHPIGRQHRKGPNNSLHAGPNDPGSPYAIGSEEGGHDAIHPELGTLDDFRELVAAAREHGLEIALDFAIQCSQDHPWLKEHPGWFSWRPDGTIKYAENPPKKYQDIVNVDFYAEDAMPDLWLALRDVVWHWVEQGVKVFRVDNPHTKPLPFWEWLIADIRERDRDVMFLSEAFTRPGMMARLGKIGYSQSYTYFTWRNTKQELTAYMQQLNQPPVRDFFRPNFWPNTPDILPEYLQFGGRPAFMIRVVLAATLSASYGIYGPAYELLEREPREPGSEEYLNSEKYQVRAWDLERPESLHDFLTRINRIRRENPALQQNWSLDFHTVDNDELLCYSKHSEADGNTVVVVVNLDAYHRQSGWVELPLEALGLDANHPYQMHDLITGARFLWHGARNYVELDPHRVPAHIFRLLRHVRTERDFEYFF